MKPDASAPKRSIAKAVFQRGDCKPLSEVIAELKTKIEEAKRQ